MRGDPEQLSDGLLAMLAQLAFINVLLLVFNLIPAFPLDGGRVARAIAWKVTGDRTRATNFTAAIGQGFSYILIGLGIFCDPDGLNQVRSAGCGRSSSGCSSARRPRAPPTRPRCSPRSRACASPT